MANLDEVLAEQQGEGHAKLLELVESGQKVLGVGVPRVAVSVSTLKALVAEYQRLQRAYMQELARRQREAAEAQAEAHRAHGSFGVSKYGPDGCCVVCGMPRLAVATGVHGG